MIPTEQFAQSALERGMQSSEHSEPRSRFKRYLGPLILLIWLPTVVSGFWFEFGAEQFVATDWPDRARQVERLEQWFQEQTRQNALSVNTITVVRVPASASVCPCATTQSLAYRQLATRLQGAPVGFFEPASVPTLPSGVDVMLFAVDGHLLFAGPWSSTAFCGASGSLVEAAIHGQLARPRSGEPVLLRGACRCAETTASSS